MAVPASGLLSLGRVNKEFIYNNYDASTAPGSNVSLKNMSTGENGAVNAASPSRPDGSAPHRLSEFYGYDHDLSLVALGLNGPVFTSTGNYSSSWLYSGLISLNDYSNYEIRLVFHYVSGNSYTGDFQVEDIFINNNGLQSTYNFANSVHSFQTSTVDTQFYDDVAFSTLQTGTSALRWNRDSGGTGSGGTGLNGRLGSSDYYVYAEASSPGYANKNFWLRSPLIYLAQSGNKEFSFYYAKYGATMGTMNVYVEAVNYGVFDAY